MESGDLLQRRNLPISLHVSLKKKIKRRRRELSTAGLLDCSAVLCIQDPSYQSTLSTTVIQKGYSKM